MIAALPNLDQMPNGERHFLQRDVIHRLRDLIGHVPQDNCRPGNVRELDQPADFAGLFEAMFELPYVFLSIIITDVADGRRGYQFSLD